MEKSDFQTIEVKIGSVKIGGQNKIIIQSMTNCDLNETKKSFLQIEELYLTGAEIIRIAIKNFDDAKNALKIIDKIKNKYPKIAIVGDFHFNGNEILKSSKNLAKILDKYRINPGNANNKNFIEMIEIATKNDKAIRIGVNSGSIDKNIKIKNEIDAMIESLKISTKLAEKIGIKKNRIVLSAKLSNIWKNIEINKKISKQFDYPLHIGATELGIGQNAIIKATAGIAPLLTEKIGDTIRVSITPKINEKRSKEVEICKSILQSLNLQKFYPEFISCPTCSRTNPKLLSEIAEKIKKEIKEIKSKKIIKQKIAVMGCIVNGIGESKNADFGIFLAEKKIQIFQNGNYFSSVNIDKNSIKNIMDILKKFLKKK